MKADKSLSLLKSQDIESLPERPGVYYLKNDKGLPIYIGKGQNLKKNVRQKIYQDIKKYRYKEFEKSIAKIDYLETGSAVGAEILEAVEIKEHLPVFNRKLKRNRFNFDVVKRYDKQGYVFLDVIHKGSEILGNKILPVSTKRQGEALIARLYAEALEISREDYYQGFVEKIKSLHPSYEFNDLMDAAVKRNKFSIENFTLKLEGEDGKITDTIFVEDSQVKTIELIKGGKRIKRKVKSDPDIEKILIDYLRNCNDWGALA